MNFLVDVLGNGVLTNLAWVICHVIRSVLLREDRNLTKMYQIALANILLYTKLLPFLIQEYFSV